MADPEKPTTNEEANLLRERELAVAKSIVGSISWVPAAANASPSREAPLGFRIKIPGNS